MPTIQAQGGGAKPGGHTLPVARVPLASVDVWWIVEGEEIQGRAGSSVGWGFLFPIGS